ncbi:MAG: type II toxin-antitoxin system RelE/ParE family toxin [Elusimicrobiota bacterium]
MAGRYELVYTRRAVKDIQRMDGLTKKRLAGKLAELRKDPLRLAKKLTHPKLGQYRYRLGNHRVVFDLKGRKIVVLRVGHRREIYR